MFLEEIEGLLERVKSNQTSVQEAMETLKLMPYKDLGFAKLDTHRHLRRGVPEAIFCEGKSLEHLQGIAKEMQNISSKFLALRASNEAYEAIKEACPSAIYYPASRVVVVTREDKDEDKKPLPTRPPILIITAGTADIPVAEEAAITAEVIGNQVERLYDVGVAGIHRLFDHLPKMMEVNVCIVVAGMEGALPSLVAGLVACPVIAVPTSIGYGVSFNGLSALLTMLNSCVPGIAVLNIDNGFGAGYLASTINEIGSKQ
ncbi:nickel pincer cofactor biosynthesis protein LarB [Chloroflexota bacterium]